MRETGGRCKPCRLVFTWEASAKRRVYMARCPKCRERLSATSLAQLGGKHLFSTEPPIFDPPPPRFMCPEHPRWAAFLLRMEDACEFKEKEPGNPASITWRCGGTHSITRRVLKAMKVRDIEKTLEFFEENGGHCACEVLFNVARNA